MPRRTTTRSSKKASKASKPVAPVAPVVDIANFWSKKRWKNPAPQNGKEIVIRLDGDRTVKATITSFFQRSAFVSVSCAMQSALFWTQLTPFCAVRLPRDIQAFRQRSRPGRSRGSVLPQTLSPGRVSNEALGEFCYLFILSWPAQTDRFTQGDIPITSSLLDCEGDTVSPSTEGLVPMWVKNYTTGLFYKVLRDVVHDEAR